MVSIYALPASYLWHICGLGSLLAVILCNGLLCNASPLPARSALSRVFCRFRCARFIGETPQFADWCFFSRKYAQ
jgi:hypothetical protein